MQSLKSSHRQAGANGKLLAMYSPALGIKCSWPFSYSFVNLTVLWRDSVLADLYICIKCPWSLWDIGDGHVKMNQIIKLWFKMGRCYGLVLDCLISACCMLNSFSEARSLGSVVLWFCYFFLLPHKNSHIPTSLCSGGIIFLLCSVYISRQRFTRRNERDL